MSSPLLLTQALAARTDSPSDIRQGVVSAVTSRGVDVALAGGLIKSAGHLTSYNPAVGDTVTMISYADSWVVLGRVLGPGTATDLASPGTGIGPSILDGCVTSGTGGDIVTSTGSLVSVPRLSLSYYHPPAHWVMLLFSYCWYSSVSADVMTTRLVEASSGFTYAVDNTQVSGGIGNFATHAIMADQSLGGAARNWSLTFQRILGTGTARLYDPNNRRTSLFAIDMGLYPSIIRVV